MEALHIIEDGSVWIEEGIIQSVGTDREIAEKYGSRLEEARVIDATGRLVTPGLVDPHTHLVYAGSRENEFEMRLKGATYMEIMNAGGGIHATTAATQKATHEQLYEESRQRLDRFLRHGVTTVEAKSGYGLTLEHELKQLEVARELNQNHPVDVVSTFMGAHAVPVAYRERPDDFVDRVIREMIPEVARRKVGRIQRRLLRKGRLHAPSSPAASWRRGKNGDFFPRSTPTKSSPTAAPNWRRRWEPSRRITCSRHRIGASAPWRKRAWWRCCFREPPSS